MILRFDLLDLISAGSLPADACFYSGSEQLGQVIQPAVSDAEHVLSYLLFGSPISSCFHWNNSVTRLSVFVAAWGIRTGHLSLTVQSGALTDRPVGESFEKKKYYPKGCYFIFSNPGKAAFFAAADFRIPDDCKELCIRLKKKWPDLSSKCKGG